MSSSEYNQLLKFLYFEGYADSYEEAENLLEEMSDEEFDQLQEVWYSGKQQYRTTASGRRVRWDEDEATDNAVSDMLQKRREAAAKKAATARLDAKGILPIRKPQQNEEFESYVENLQNEGYDLSNWTWDGIEEFYIAEAKKEFPSDKVKRQSAKHMRNFLTRPNSAVGQRSKQKSKKMDAIRSTVEVGDDPRNTMHGQDLRKIREDFEEVVEYLFVEGYADTIESAELMAESISTEWVDEILDEKHVNVIDPKGADYRASQLGRVSKRRKPIPDKYKYSEGDFSPRDLSPGARRRRDERRQGVGGFNEAKADPQDAVQRLRARNMRLQQDHPEVPSGRDQTEYRRKRHQESRGKKKGL